MSETEELKPCPFCGEADIRTDFDRREWTHYAVCYGCFCRLEKDTKEEAIKAWNTRHPRNCN